MTSSALEAESRLIADIYDAALAPALWPRVLQQVAQDSGSNSAILLATDQLNSDYTLAFTHNIAEELLRVYREEGLDLVDMEVNATPLIREGVGSTLLSTEVYGSQEEYIRRCGAFYERCLKPANIHYLTVGLLDQGDFRFAMLGLHRPADWVAPTHEDAARLTRLGTHIRRALQIHRQLIEVQRQNARLYAMLDGLNTGVILLGARGGVRYANPRAESLLRRHGALRVTPRGSLQAVEAEQDAGLQGLIRTAISTGLRAPGAAGAGVIGLRQAGGTPVMVTVTPLSELAGYGDLASDGVSAALFLTDPQAGRRLSRKLLRQLYGLSERESDLCEAFVNHATLEGVATACGLAMSSVRSYMKAIYEKTGQRSQGELMRLLMGLTLEFEHIR